jgi:hypothetical protein
MASVKRRKIEENASPEAPTTIKPREKQKGAFPAPPATASPEPAQSKEKTREKEQEIEAPVQKSFKDLVGSALRTCQKLLTCVGHHRLIMRRLYSFGI